MVLKSGEQRCPDYKTVGGEAVQIVDEEVYNRAKEIAVALNNLDEWWMERINKMRETGLIGIDNSPAKIHKIKILRYAVSGIGLADAKTIIENC